MSVKTIVCAALLLAAASFSAHADYTLSGTNTGDGNVDSFAGQAAESYSFNYDGGAAFNQYLNNWGSPGVGNALTPYLEALPTYGFIVTFTGGGPIDAASITIGNGANCVGSTNGGTTFCTDTSDIWVASLTGPDTIQFLAQNSSFFLSNNQNYFVNVFFDGATPTAFTGVWLTEFSPNGVPEPTTLVLLGAGLAGLGLVRRRRS